MFRRFFNRTPAPKDFRERVLNVAARLFPDLVVTASATQDGVVVVNGVQLGLQNLEAKFNLSDRAEKTLEELVEEHFAFVLNKEAVIPGWDYARTLLRPQLMPPEYALQGAVLSFPFGKTLAIGIVVDGVRGYSYVRQEDAEKWGVTPDDLLTTALSNFDETSRGKTPMHFSEQGNIKWVGIETKDGFDAARILIPDLQRFLSGKLGSPFHFAVPNRDFLICWNTDAGEEFVESAVSKIAKDFERQPYPLSPNVFTLDQDGTVTEEA